MDDKQILRIFESSEDPVLFTGEVADELGFSSQGTIKRLKSLRDNEFLTAKKRGHQFVWWLTDRGRAHLAGEFNADSDDASDPD